MWAVLHRRVVKEAHVALSVSPVSYMPFSLRRQPDSLGASLQGGG